MTSARPPLPVLCGTPAWTISGVNVFVASLVRGLRARGVDARVLITNAEPTRDAPLPLPDDLPIDRLALRRGDSMFRRWALLRACLTERSPCIFLPGWDLEAAALTPTLPPAVRVVGVVHSDDPWYHGLVGSLGRYLDAVVCVSRHLEERVRTRHAELAGRCRTIAYGLELPSPPPPRGVSAAGPIRIVYAGRLVQNQKRVLDIPRILAALDARGVPFRLDVLGDGPDRGALARDLELWTSRGQARLHGTVANRTVFAHYDRADVALLVSEFEGLPIFLLEAMSRGCVPVVSDLQSGIPEIVLDGVTGLRAPVGDVAAFADRLARLHAEPALLAALSERAARHVDAGPYTVERMTDRYQVLFEGLAGGSDWRRPPGPITLPPGRAIPWMDYLPPPLRLPLRALRARRRRQRGPTTWRNR